ncbi:MAG: SCP2 sterol-binding domain-containing protein [Ketobacteraceae bacterium]|nr:SCP2 sterol-binding domain-containing protein [Ketobacteraceae bacterium]
MGLKPPVHVLRRGLRIAGAIHRTGMEKRFDLDVLSLALQRIANRIYQRHPDAAERLESISGTRFLVSMTNLPFRCLITIYSQRIRVDCNLRYPPSADVTISGSYQALAGIFEGDADADSLFFSRDIQIQGNIEALVTLRNALDNEDISIVSELTPQFGRYAGVAHEALQLVNQKLLAMG